MSAKIDLNTTTISSNTQAIDRLVQESKLTKKIAEEAREKVLVVEGKLQPINKQIEEHKAQLSLLELKETG